MKKRRSMSPVLLLIIVAVFAALIIKSGINLGPSQNNGSNNGESNETVVVDTATNRDLDETPTGSPPIDQYMPATAKDLYIDGSSEK